MVACSGPTNIPDGRQRWLCQGKHSTMRIDLFKRLLSLKPWCVESDIIRGVYSDHVGSGCFRKRSDALAYIQSIQASSPPLARMRRRR